jgi:2-keto-4-pentenoate hydratase
MEKGSLRAMAACVLADYDTRTPGRSFARIAGFDAPQAYSLQTEITRLREERGERVIGYKIGCSSLVIQRQLGIDEPIFGRIFETGRHVSGARLSRSGFANLAIEGELAVRLATGSLELSLTDGAWDEAVESIFPVIELHHYVVPDDGPQSQDLIATSGMHAGFVMPEQHHRGWVHVQRMTLRIDDVEVDATVLPWTMQDPIASLRWLSARLGKEGLCLAGGQIILTGSAMRLHPVSAGSRVVVDAPPLGRCCVVIDP